MSLPLKANGINCQLLVRAYNDGVAIRYIVPVDENVTINEDITAFVLQESAECYWANYANSNEELHHISTFAELPEDTALLAPLTAKSGNFYLSFSEANCLNFPDLSWIKKGNHLKANFATNPQGC